MKRLALTCGVVLAAWLAQPVQSIASAQEPAASERPTRKRATAKKVRPKRGKKAKEEAKAAAAEPKPASDKEAAVPSGEGGVAPAADGGATASSALAGGAEQVRKEGETEVKTVEFTGLDIEGQLKTPQLLYFLTRLRAEFDRPRLPHRSFMPELSRSSGEKSLR